MLALSFGVVGSPTGTRDPGDASFATQRDE
jgi:hypothetical protein